MNLQSPTPKTNQAPAITNVPRSIGAVTLSLP